MKLVVGLGNPGKKYASTRHNIGFRVVEKAAEKMGLSLKEASKFGGRFIKGDKISLLLPETYMNESGQAVRACADFYKLLSSEILVVFDDVYLPFGTLKVKPRGSSGGHNGLKSIESHLGSDYYPRLKCGIGDERDGSLADHVLAPFTKEEEEKLPKFIEDAAQVVIDLIHTDIHIVMNAVNRKENNEREEKPL